MDKEIRDFMQKIINAGGEVYLVGGAVRDLLLKREVKDWDFTTNLEPEKIKNIFPKNSFYNNQFGTVSVMGKNKQIWEITTFRTEIGYEDKRHPDIVSWGKTLREDVERRDFTINAMAMDIKGKIYDFFDGQKDLANMAIKAVGKADIRFQEDALRMMRAVRIGCELGFMIEENTFLSIQNNAVLIKEIAGERIKDELYKILQSDFAADGISLLKNSGLLEQIIPELMQGNNFAQNKHHIYDVWTHNLETLRNCQSNNPLTKLACLLHDIGKPMVAKGEGEARTFHNHEVKGSRVALEIGKRLRLSKNELQQLFILVRWHMFSVSEMQTDKAVRRFIKNVTVPYLEEMICLRRADRIGSGAKETSWRWELFKKRLIEVQKQPFSVKDLKINGGDVMKELKIKPGPEVGKILNDLFKMVEENPKLNERSFLLKSLKKKHQGNGNAKRRISTAKTANKKS
jgi:putative nucleotidyltransferase with HDIG domain